MRSCLKEKIEFKGYETTTVNGAKVVALIKGDDTVDSLQAGDEGEVVLDQTPFYAESGGQVGDAGSLVAPGVEFSVTDTQKIKADVFGHHGAVVSGQVSVGDAVRTQVDTARRASTMRHHSATHLMHKALRQVLGGHVQQKGSLVDPGKTRFDFAHNAPLTDDEIRRVEELVNAEIIDNHATSARVMPIDEAQKLGAMMLFGEKYGDEVRVLDIGSSRELCGGTHVQRTGDIGVFKIVAESGVAAGVRRIEALTGLNAVAWAQQQRGALHNLVSALHVSDEQALDAIEKLQAEAKKLAREVSQLKTKLAMAGGGSDKAGYDIVDAGGLKLARAKTAGLDKDAVRAMADSMKAAITSGVVLVTTTGDEGKVSIVVSVTPDLVKTIAAGKLVKELAPIVGGGGGGRPDFAEAGGKDASRIDELHAQAPEVLARLLGR